MGMTKIILEQRLRLRRCYESTLLQANEGKIMSEPIDHLKRAEDYANKAVFWGIVAVVFASIALIARTIQFIIYYAR